ncbi:MAG: hypothetical protein F6J94_28290 [Moorea sp. SIO1F2]|nr:MULTISPECIES: hypothetical protein [unclassified Moorena]NEO07439.1 hypothetical protein [Moorena sp. SIO3I8]NEO22523.1 hypothetical protein [Moorena sp. SIO4A5]NEP23938.1 hypothetical protein [Moorena sp. SIO3I6]NEQ60086.1 hypothetical protein [Moorena sp. SIO4A1]NET85652.1 hypothetical protein [Moorena sp. SIO1F2]
MDLLLSNQESFSLGLWPRYANSLGLWPRYANSLKTSRDLDFLRSPR